MKNITAGDMFRVGFILSVILGCVIVACVLAANCSHRPSTPQETFDGNTYRDNSVVDSTCPQHVA